jgi:hypothetical protein
MVKPWRYSSSGTSVYFATGLPKKFTNQFDMKSINFDVSYDDSKIIFTVSKNGQDKTNDAE